jgi:hypothetical protein
MIKINVNNLLSERVIVKLFKEKPGIIILGYIFRKIRSFRSAFILQLTVITEQVRLLLNKP